MSSLPIIFILSTISLCFCHMSLNHPSARHRKANGAEYAKWEANEPMVPIRPTICHGLPSAPVPEQNKFSAGQIITIDIYGTVPHTGGHCSFWYSLNDVTFTKIADVKDCTLHPHATQVKIPDTLPAQCGTKCTFAWSWIPGVSGQCEIYQTCADISVSGLSGTAESNPQTFNFQTIIDDRLCQRVDVKTHWSPLFQPLRLQKEVVPTMSPELISNWGNIFIENPGEGGIWWHQIAVIDVLPGYEIGQVSFRGNGRNGWSSCSADGTSGSIVYYCAPVAGANWNYETFTLPVSVRIVASNGAMIEATSVITDFRSGSIFDMGCNFGSRESVVVVEANVNKQRQLLLDDIQDNDDVFYTDTVWQFSQGARYNLLGMLGVMFIAIVSMHFGWNWVRKTAKVPSLNDGEMASISIESVDYL